MIEIFTSGLIKNLGFPLIWSTDGVNSLERTIFLFPLLINLLLHFVIFTILFKRIKKWPKHIKKLLAIICIAVFIMFGYISIHFLFDTTIYLI